LDAFLFVGERERPQAWRYETSFATAAGGWCLLTHAKFSKIGTLALASVENGRRLILAIVIAKARGGIKSPPLAREALHGIISVPLLQY
jgi:hypothetical protein